MSKPGNSIDSPMPDAEGRQDRLLRFVDSATETAYSRTYFACWRRTMQRSALFSAALMLPAGFHNLATGQVAAFGANAVALAGCFVYIGVLRRADAEHWWKLVGLFLALIDTLTFFAVDVIAVPHLPFVRTPEHVVTLFESVQALLLVYCFVLGRFPLAWYMVYAAFNVLVGLLCIAVGFPGALSYFASSSGVFVLPVACLLVLLAYYQENTSRGEFIANVRLERERERSEALLLNILPAPIAHRLKGLEAGASSTIADGFDEVGVLFADLVGFSPISARMDPVTLINLLNAVFTHCDQLATRHGIEKIKTIGDAYMAATGLPEPVADHAAALAEMALDLRDTIGQFRDDNGTPLSLRIGLNIGPVIAGVIGVQRFIYDLWGDTVNIASRMESHGAPGAIQTTETAYLLLRDRFQFGPPAEIAVKGCGIMTVYTLQNRLSGPTMPPQPPRRCV